MKRPFSAAWPSGTPPDRPQSCQSGHRRNTGTVDHTSIQIRIDYWKRKAAGNESPDPNEDFQPSSLMPFSGNLRQHVPPGLPFSAIDYLELVDWTGRIIRDDKRGSISDELPPIIQRLEISPEHWLELTTQFEDRFKGLVGSIQSLKSMCALFGLKRKPNFSNRKFLFR